MRNVRGVFWLLVAVGCWLLIAIASVVVFVCQCLVDFVLWIIPEGADEFFKDIE